MIWFRIDSFRRTEHPYIESLCNEWPERCFIHNCTKQQFVAALKAVGALEYQICCMCNTASARARLPSVLYGNFVREGIQARQAEMHQV